MENEYLQLQVFKSVGFSDLGYRLFIDLRYYNDEGWERLFFLQDSISPSAKYVEDNYKKIVDFLDKNILVPIKSVETARLVLKKTYTFDIEYKEQILRVLDKRPELVSDITPFSPLILKLNEKHGDRYFLLTRPSQAAETYLKILTDRYNEEWYNWMENYKPYKLTKPEFTQQEVDELPSDKVGLKRQLTAEIDKYNKQLAEQEETRETYKKIVKTINEKNGVSAYHILKDLKDGEYENFEIIEPE